MRSYQNFLNLPNDYTIFASFSTMLSALSATPAPSIESRTTCAMAITINSISHTPFALNGLEAISVSRVLIQSLVHQGLQECYNYQNIW